MCRVTCLVGTFRVYVLVQDVYLLQLERMREMTRGGVRAHTLYHIRHLAVSPQAAVSAALQNNNPVIYATRHPGRPLVCHRRSQSILCCPPAQREGGERRKLDSSRFSRRDVHRGRPGADRLIDSADAREGSQTKVGAGRHPPYRISCARASRPPSSMSTERMEERPVPCT